MIKRIAMWRVKDDDKASKVVAIKNALLSMKGKVPSLLDMEVGVNISTSAAAYDIVFVGTFLNLDALKEFETDDFHKGVAGLVTSMREHRVVVDYQL